MGKRRPYLKYEPRLATFEDARFQMERIIAAINRIAEDTGLTQASGRTTSGGSSVAPGGGSGSTPVDLSNYVTQDELADAIALLDAAKADRSRMKRYAHFVEAG
jgi:hypothetical protein